VLDTGAASRGSDNANTNKEKDVRRWFVEQDLIEGVIYLPENLFYNTTNWQRSEAELLSSQASNFRHLRRGRRPGKSNGNS